MIARTQSARTLCPAPLFGGNAGVALGQGANIGKDELQWRGCPDESWEAWHGRLVIFMFFRTPFHGRKMMDPFQVMPSHLGSHIFSASQRSMVLIFQLTVWSATVIHRSQYHQGHFRKPKESRISKVASSCWIEANYLPPATKLAYDKR